LQDEEAGVCDDVQWKQMTSQCGDDDFCYLLPMAIVNGCTDPAEESNGKILVVQTMLVGETQYKSNSWKRCPEQHV